MTETYRILNRDRKVRRAQRNLSKRLGKAVTLFTACAFIGQAIIGRTSE